MKRGKHKSNFAQITVFIIIAILIVAIVALFFLYRYKTESNNTPIIIRPIQYSAEQCIKDVGENALFSIGWSGGYFSPPINASTINGIPYYYIKGQNLMPTKEKIENEISNYLNEMLIYCYFNFQNYSGFIIKQGEIKTTTNIEDNKVIFKVVSPLVITSGSRTYNLDKFNVEIPVRLGKIYEFAENITLDNFVHEERICLSCINEKAKEMDFYAEMTDYDNETIIFTLIDKKASILRKEFRFNFANKYKMP